MKAQEAAASIKRYGESLFEQTLGADRNTYARYKEALQREGVQKLRFEISGSPQFHSLHWEALKDPEQPRALDATMVRKRREPQNVSFVPEVVKEVRRKVLQALLTSGKQG